MTIPGPGGQRVTVETPVPRPEDLEEDEEQEGAEGAAELGAEGPQDEFDITPGEGYIRVSRIGLNGEQKFLRKVDRKILAEDLGFIGRTWGGGTYFLEIFKDTSKGPRWERKLTKEFDVDEFGPPKGAFASMAVPPAPEPEEDEDDELPPVYNPGAGQVQPDATMQMLMRAGSQGGKGEMVAIIGAMLTSQREADERNRKMFLELVSAMKGQQPTIDQVLSTADRMIAARGEPGQDPMSREIQNAVGLLVKDTIAKKFGVDTGSLTAGGGGGEGGSMIERMAMRVVDVLSPLLARAVANAGSASPTARRAPLRNPSHGAPPGATPGPLHAVVPPPSVVALPGATVEQTPASAGGESTASEPGVLVPPAPAVESGEPIMTVVPTQMMLDIKARFDYQLAVPALLTMARSNADPVSSARKIWVIAGRNVPVLLALINRDDLVGYLSAFEPEAASHADWLGRVKTALLAIEAEEMAAADQPEDDEDDGG